MFGLVASNSSSADVCVYLASGYDYIGGLVQESHNYFELAMELHLFCTSPSILYCDHTLIAQENFHKQMILYFCVHYDL